MHICDVAYWLWLFNQAVVASRKQKQSYITPLPRWVSVELILPIDNGSHDGSVQIFICLCRTLKHFFALHGDVECKLCFLLSFLPFFLFSSTISLSLSLPLMFFLAFFLSFFPFLPPPPFFLPMNYRAMG